MVLNNKTRIIKKINSEILVSLYFFIISLTSYHFHPVNLANYKSLINTAPTEKSSHHYTAEKCPILSFANNGFNSNLTNKVISFSNSIVSLLNFPILNSSYKNKLYTSVKHRGPPIL